MELLDKLRRYRYEETDYKPFGHARGLFDVFASFAKGLGYTVYANVLLPDWENANIHLGTKVINIANVGNELFQTACLAHEIAHIYTWDVLNNHPQVSNQYGYTIEQITEATACALLEELEIDYHHNSSAYINKIEKRIDFINECGKGYPLPTFSSKQLDGAIKHCYTRLSRDFNQFLQGGIDVQSDYGSTHERESLRNRGNPCYEIFGDLR